MQASQTKLKAILTGNRLTKTNKKTNKTCITNKNENNGCNLTTNNTSQNVSITNQN